MEHCGFMWRYFCWLVPTNEPHDVIISHDFSKDWACRRIEGQECNRWHNHIPVDTNTESRLIHVLSGQNHHTQPVSVSMVQDVHAWQEGAVAMGSAPVEGQFLSVLQRCEMWQLTMERHSLRCRPLRGGAKLQVVQKDAAPQALLDTAEWHGTPPVTSREPNYIRPRNCYHAKWFNRRRAP